jgi:HaeII restriction endonuclease
LTVEVSMNPNKQPILSEFQDFAKRVINLEPDVTSFKTSAKIYRVGVTNAADRGMDIWANFGLAIQIKHLSLSEELAENIVSSISADRIVIVCKQAEQKIILSLLNQIGWKSRIQSIVTENDLNDWYEKALRGKYGAQIGDKMLKILSEEIKTEFPVTENTVFAKFFNGRGYDTLRDAIWG